MTKPFLIIDAEKYQVADESIDGPNLAIVMADDSFEATDCFLEHNPDWKSNQITVRYVPTLIATKNKFKAT